MAALPRHPPGDRCAAMPSGLLLARGAVLGLVVVLTGAASHLLAGGLLPAPPLMGLVVLNSGLVSTLLLRRPASAVRVVAMVVGGQAVVHLVLTLLAGHRPRGGSGAHPADGAFEAGTSVAGDPLSTAPWAHLAADLTAEGPAMVLAHLLAAGVIGWWLAQGEAALWAIPAALLTLLCRVLRAAWPRPLLGAGASARLDGWFPPVRTRARPHGHEGLTGALIRRGPPARRRPLVS